MSNNIIKTPKSVIVPLSKSETRNFSDRPVSNIWIERSISNPTKNKELMGSEISELIEHAKETIYLMVHDSHWNFVEKHLTDLSKKIDGENIRIYVLCNRLNLSKESSFINHVLIHEVPELPEGFMILTDVKDHPAGAWVSSSGENIFSFLLDENQIKNMFAFFCEQFWKKAKSEQICGEIRPFSEKEEISLKIISQPNDNSILKFDLPNGQFNQVFWVNQSTFLPKTLVVTEESLTLPNEDIKNSNCKEIRANTVNQNIPFMLIIGDSESYFSVQYEKLWFVLSLNVSQVIQAKEWFKQQFDNANLVWSKNIKRKELFGKFFFKSSNLHNRLQIKDRSKIDFGIIPCNLNTVKGQSSMDTLRPEEDKFIDDGISLMIEYLWEIIPPKLPEKAKEDSIYHEWDLVSKVKDSEDKAIENEPEPLPRTGKLFMNAGKRYLQIEFWEDLEVAQQEAKRFNNADIVI